ncbi:YARHG domain-containing protein [Reichenbachiella sp. MSK19-1]|nr:YARHG domain-containing protein [Reichenbachiella sp. MSK19-1]
MGFQNSIIVQVESYYKYEANMDWDHNFMNLNNPRIDLDGTFSCDEFKGKFLNYRGFGLEKNVLKINEAFTFFDDQVYELGSRIGNTNYKLKGRFTEASTELLNPKELYKMSSTDLKLMRNEIFARYGYKFKPGGEMDSYFSRQSWYKPEFTDVNKYLTALERYNIELIRTEEQRP